MHKQSADKLLRGQLYIDYTSGPIVPCRKRDIILRYGLYPGIGNGYAIGISSKILNSIAKLVKRLLDVGAPVFLVETVPKFIPRERVPEIFAFASINELAFIMQGLKFSQELAAKLFAHHMNGQEERFSTSDKLVFRGQAAAGDYRMYVRMVV